MITINLPSDIEAPIAKEAQRLGTTTELLAIESLCKPFLSETDRLFTGEETLFDYLSDHIGTVNGTTEALSENCGKQADLYQENPLNQVNQASDNDI